MSVEKYALFPCFSILPGKELPQKDHISLYQSAIRYLTPHSTISRCKLKDHDYINTLILKRTYLPCHAMPCLCKFSESDDVMLKIIWFQGLSINS